MHIRVEQQMKLHIETLQDKIDEMTKTQKEELCKFEEEVAEIKREKRRLGDLLTLREQEVDRLNEQLQRQSDRTEHEKNS